LTRWLSRAANLDELPSPPHRSCPCRDRSSGRPRDHRDIWRLITSSCVGGAYHPWRERHDNMVASKPGGVDELVQQRACFNRNDLVPYDDTVLMPAMDVSSSRTRGEPRIMSSKTSKEEEVRPTPKDEELRRCGWRVQDATVIGNAGRAKREKRGHRRRRPCRH
jgi:hypothetical protein